jgi:predicted nucleic acid-binding protein
MNKILIDSSVWISYFKDSKSHNDLDHLILHNQICTNNLILAELLPHLQMKRQNKIIEGLLQIDNIPLMINWDMIMTLQISNLKNGINKVGIPDLIILENAIANNLVLYSEDKHFRLMSEITNLKLYDKN